MANELIPRAIPRNTPVLWHNPFAIYPLDRDALPLSQRIWDRKTSQWSFIEGKTGAEIFHLDEKWPDEPPITSKYLSLAQINGNVRGSQQTTQGID